MFLEKPIILEDFLSYIDTIKGKSTNTVIEYNYDLTTFFKYLKLRFRLVSKDEIFENIDISDIDEYFLKRIKIEDLHAYMSYTDRHRGNKNATRARKVASIKSFFKYLYEIRKIISENPAILLESPKINSRQPVYLTLDQAQRLLDTIKESDSNFKVRDYAIITLFLNCGLRLSELSNININELKGDILRVIGKGNKERTIYLNNSCIDAINDYLEIRNTKKLSTNALFVSRKNNRFSDKGIQHMVKKYIKLSGLDPDKYSVHKLRHTAATLMYKYGDVDIRALQQILGHENISTTQIYTHVDDERLREAVNKNPLSR